MTVTTAAISTYSIEEMIDATQSYFGFFVKLKTGNEKYYLFANDYAGIDLKF